MSHLSDTSLSRRKREWTDHVLWHFSHRNIAGCQCLFGTFNTVLHQTSQQCLLRSSSLLSFQHCDKSIHVTVTVTVAAFCNIRKPCQTQCWQPSVLKRRKLVVEVVVGGRSLIGGPFKSNFGWKKLRNSTGRWKAGCQEEFPAVRKCSLKERSIFLGIWAQCKRST